MAKKTAQDRYCIIGNGNYGLYYGIVRTSDAEVLKSRSVRVYECRHVARWYGRTGGITSLAAHGPCGPSAGESRIGSPCPSSLITDVRAIHECAPDAVAAFAATEAK